MKQERFMVIDNQKGVVIPLQEENNLAIDKIREINSKTEADIILDEKVNKLHKLLKLLVKQSISETIKEYNAILTNELKLYEREELKRWEKIEAADLERWEKFEGENEKRWKILEDKEKKRLDQIEKSMENHFKTLDKNIRQKQDEGKRKKHSLF